MCLRDSELQTTQYNQTMLAQILGTVVQQTVYLWNWWARWHICSVKFLLEYYDYSVQEYDDHVEHTLNIFIMHSEERPSLNVLAPRRLQTTWSSYSLALER